MRRSPSLLVTLPLAALLLGSTAAAVPADASPSAQGSTARAARSCASPTGGNAACNALVRTDAPKPGPNAVPAGYGPADLRLAYNLPSDTAGIGRTIAIIDAYDAPTAESDLGVYRAQFGLPSCTTSNGCFKKVNQSGGTKLPRANGGWAQETSLDLDMASAICPNCHLLLVEASTPSFANLGAAVNYAASQFGVVAISNSYGGADASDATYGAYYNHPGIAVTVSSGDSGYGVQYPASSKYVVAVGGTSLTKSGTSYAETAWSGAGSGCSTLNTQPSFQASARTGCANRAVADVSAVADPATGVAVYDSYAYQGRSGWLVFGGTSVAAPVIAGVYALATTSHTANSSPAYPASSAYANASSLHDVSSGSNGTCPTPQWCIAGPGWDGPTGLGTPNTAAGF